MAPEAGRMLRKLDLSGDDRMTLGVGHSPAIGRDDSAVEGALQTRSRPSRHPPAVGELLVPTPVE
ncbi:hypothetical protein BO221_31635 [Archangium sp. Cb G35]|nr:hypothetical protein BO221_31635 [Archangium sp. Cb G35]